jgi:hypothetical protein
MLAAGFIANEPEAFVDQQSCNRPVRHTRVLRFQTDENRSPAATPTDTGGIRQ